MAEVASLELCKKLYELSGWSYSSVSWTEHGAFPLNHEMRDVGVEICPAYPLGYLLRKLPPSVDEEHGFVLNHRSACYLNPEKPGDVLYHNIADTPEDCVAKLCIALFEQNILKREE